MSLTKSQEKYLNTEFNRKFDEVWLCGLRAGATGILGAVLNMCNEWKTVEDIKVFCEKSLNMDGMKKWLEVVSKYKYTLNFNPNMWIPVNVKTID